MLVIPGALASTTIRKIKKNKGKVKVAAVLFAKTEFRFDFERPVEFLCCPPALFDPGRSLSSSLQGSSTWWPCSSCSECVSTRLGAELKPRASARVWAVTRKNRCPNPEVGPLLITGTVGNHPAGVLQEGRPHKLLTRNFRTLSVDVSPDPTASESYDFRTIQNIDCYNTDFCVKVRHGMRYWNMTVQWWLHHYIYPNSPFSSYTLR